MSGGDERHAHRAAGSLDEDLAVAHRLADLASEIAVPYFGEAVSHRVKDDGTPVSDADLAVDRHLMELLSRERPDDGVLSEESGARGSAPRRWILDPIDGTSNFIAGDPAWGTHVALEDHGEIVLGIITRPVSGQRWWATRGGGTYQTAGETRDGIRQHVSTIDDLGRSRLTLWLTEPDELMNRVKSQGIWVEPHLDNILQLLAGDLEAIVNAIGQPWDHAPWVILTEEAGGRFRDGRGGRRIDQGTGLYTNGQIDAQLDRLMEPHR